MFAPSLIRSQSASSTMGPKGGRATFASRRQLVAKQQEQNGLCFYCEQPAWLPDPRPKSKDLQAEGNLGEDHHMNRRRKKTLATREHLVTKADGGGDNDSNIVMDSAACNHERGDAPVDVWKSYVNRAITCNPGD
jgi:hypothetical protein